MQTAKEVIRHHIKRGYKLQSRQSGRHNWADQHERGMHGYVGSMISAWGGYADQHCARFESRIADDGFIGPEWLQIGQSLRALLNGEIGGLDGGLTGSTILGIMEAHGFNDEGEVIDE